MSTMPEPDQTSTIPDSAKTLPAGILNEIDASVDKPATWIIDKLLAEGEQMLVFGAPKVGKSQLALQLACCLAMGEPFLGWPVTGQKRVLYLNFEMGKRVFMLRIARHISRLMAEKEKRECEESGNEYIGEADPWHKLGDDVPLAELRDKINDAINNQLFFCSDFKSLEGDHVPKAMDSLKKVRGSNLKSDAEADQELLVRYWQSVIKDVEPDLVIFDTLSKTHSINESDNSEIQRALMRIRQICQIPSAAIDGSHETHPTGSKRDGGKYIAHIIVHHARKSSTDSKKKGQISMDLDSIRGASAIRAEADVICGVFFAKKKTATHEETNRHLVVEARNFAPFDQPLNFEVFAFCHPRQRTPEEVDAERDESNKLDQLIQDLIREAFVQSGMRGLKIETLYAKVITGLGTQGRSGAFSVNGLKNKLKALAGKIDSQFEIRVKAEMEEERVNYPHERKEGKTIYWIKDNSPWLDEEPLKSAIEFRKLHPYTIAKEPKPKKPKVTPDTGGLIWSDVQQQRQ